MEARIGIVDKPSFFARVTNPQQTKPLRSFLNEITLPQGFYVFKHYCATMFKPAQKHCRKIILLELLLEVAKVKFSSLA